MNEPSDLPGALRFGVSGEGVTIDPATGELSLLPEALAAGIELAITSVAAEGAVMRRFRLTLAATADGGAPVPMAAPTLLGAARIGTAVAVEPGTWSGAPVFAFRWLRDGAEIAGADGPAYVPAPEDDGAALSCRVTASNAAGSAVAETTALVVAWPAPVVVGGLPDLALAQGSGPRLVEAATAFEGGGLVFAAAGAGARADPATGRVTLSTDTLLGATPVIVSAANSGGAASVGFTVSVAAAVLPPAATGSIADVGYAFGSGPQTVSAQAAFAGAGLGFALVEAPAGVTIDPATGLVTIPTDVALAGAAVTVRASNAAGAATLGFAVTVGAGATATDFDSAGALAELGFLHSGPAPALGLADGAARLVPAATGRAHGVWSRAAGDGLYRALVRWSAKSIGAAGYVPFALGARVRLDGADFAGVFVEAYRSASGPKWLRLVEYAGAGEAVAQLQKATPGWSWDTWYWVEMALDGASVKARLYPEAAKAPAWQVEATTAAAGPGAFGPAGFPIAGESPTVDIRRLEHLPAAPAAPDAPAAAQDGEWTLLQITEQL